MAAMISDSDRSEGRARLLAEFDGSVCPACHHRFHDPGSCEECPRCELHTDEAAAFVLRIEPELLAGVEGGLDVERLARALYETQAERLAGGADGFGLGSHEADAGAIAAAYSRLIEDDPAPSEGGEGRHE